jgi:hypothetical protein
MDADRRESLRRSLRTLAESHAANRALRAMYPGLIGDLTRRLSTMHVGLAETSARNIPYVDMTSVGCPPEAGVENQPPSMSPVALRRRRSCAWVVSVARLVGWAILLNGRPGPSFRKVERAGKS